MVKNHAEVYYCRLLAVGERIKRERAEPALTLVYFNSETQIKVFAAGGVKSIC